MKLELPNYLLRLFHQGKTEAEIFDWFMQVKGRVYRDMPGRLTQQVKLAERSLFIKQHFGVGWGEVIKNLIALRWPVVGAETEVDAILACQRAGIDTTPLVGYGVKGQLPPTQQSFLITEDLGDIEPLESYCGAWKLNPPSVEHKRELIRQVAMIVRKLHQNGMNHRDLYLCHFCIDRPKLVSGEIRLYLIDLHRVGRQAKISDANRLKDLAALYFSAMDCGLSIKDYWRFLHIYFEERPSVVIRNNRKFWYKLYQRALFLYAKYQRKYVLPSLKQKVEP